MQPVMTMLEETDLILTADPDFVDLALDEVQAATPTPTILGWLGAGVLLLQLTEPVTELTARWRGAPPIFVRHCCPAHLLTPLHGELAADLTLIRDLALEYLLPLLDPQTPFSVQSRVLVDLPYKPFDLNTPLAEALQLASGASLNVRAPDQVLSVVCAIPQRAGALRATPHAFLGLSATVDNLSAWAGGMHRFAREAGQISRSEFKLLEALDVFQLRPPAHGVALDLGASPGGWTRVLRQHDQYVTAVDPGELDPRLAHDRGIRHKRMTAEAYLADEPDQFDVIVNDMRMDARDSARRMVAYAPLLYPHGWALMTLKLPEHNPRPVLDHALTILRQAYQIHGARHLFHNRSEITVYLRRL
jgi:23S rRNA (cytidine2498-2'-O)-methyltransferase